MKLINPLMLTAVCGTANALSFQYDNGMRLDVNGYGGYRYVESTAPNHFYSSDPELGLLLNLHVNDNISLFTQFKYGDTIDQSVVYSFISADKWITDDLTFNVKAGRLRHDFGLYGAARINPMTRNGVISPQAIYWDVLGLNLVSGDGINFNIKWKSFTLGYSIDKPIVANSQASAYEWTSGLLKTINNYFGSHQLVNLKYEPTDIPLIIKASWTSMDLGNDNSPRIGMLFPGNPNMEQRVDMLNAGIEYSWDKLNLSAEAMSIKPFFSTWGDFEDHSYGISYTGIYEINDNLNFRVNYNEYLVSHATASKTIPWNNDTKDINFGFNIHEDKWMFGIEAHHINGGRWANVADYVADPNAYKDWWMIATNFAYYF